MILPVLAATGALASCSPRDPFANPFNDPRPGWASVPNHPFAPHGLPMFDGRRGTVLTWADLSNAVAWADVIVIGEQHTDPAAHQVQHAIVAETLARFPRTAVSFEMLERNEQPKVDAYLRSEITVDEFIDSTNSRNWAGKDTWVVFYQPMIDSAKERFAPVVAANAPRDYVRKARLEGYESLRELPPEEQALFDIPWRPDKPAYRARFDAIMIEGHGGAESSDAPSSEALANGFRSQSLWDSTMAASIVNARREAGQSKSKPRADKVIHCVGQFHSDFDGGLIQEIAARDAFARILTISVDQRDGVELAPEDRNRAAIVIYSGAPAPPPPPEPPPATVPLPISKTSAEAALKREAGAPPVVPAEPTTPPTTEPPTPPAPPPPPSP